MAAPGENILHLSDDVLLKIFSYLTSVELCIASKVCRRFQLISSDRTLVRVTDFEGAYALSDDMFRKYVQAASSRMEQLSCNHCYWLSGKVLETILPRCQNLQTLSVIDCNLTPKRLCRVIAPLEHLRALAFSVHAIKEFCDECDQSEDVQGCFGQLRELVIHFKRGSRAVQQYTISINVVQQRTFLEHCTNLEKLSIISAPNSFPKDLLRPLIENANCLQKLKEIGINDGVDPSARMFFFGILLQLCKLDLHYKTLLMPSANLARLQTKPEFKNCFKHSKELRHLNVSRAEVDFSSIGSPMSSLAESHNLQYLNIAENYKVDSNQLKLIASGCPNLTSLNLQNCPHILMNNDTGQVDTSGLECVVNKCNQLRHLNLCGIHVHSMDGPQPIQTLCSLLSSLHGLQSLSLPACSLCTPETEDAVPTTMIGNCKKRVRVSYSAPQGFGKRKRISFPIASTSRASMSGASVYEGPESTGELEYIVQSCPNMKHFELTGAGFRSAFNSLFPFNLRRHSYTACAEAHTVCDEDLQYLSRWQNLTSLQISGLPAVLHGNSLVSIAQGCVGLERLYLAFVGSGAHCVYLTALSQALRHLLNLRDFRLEQHNVNLNSLFFGSFHGCQKLERLCVISRNGSLSAEQLELTMEMVPSLTVVQLFTGATLSLCKRLQSDLTSRFKASRPALNVTIIPALHDDLADMIRCIPAKHYDGLLLHDSQVAVKPEDW